MSGRHRVDFESIDSRTSLRTYAIVMGLAGFVLAAWGQIWLGSHLAEVRWGLAVLTRVCGAVMIAAAILAFGLSSADAWARRRLFSWFIAAHVVVWAMLVMQSYVTLDIQILRQMSWALLAVILGLLYVRFPAGFPARGARSLSGVPEHTFDASTPDEQQIREAAAQEERNRLARELHDAVKQQIFAIQTSAATAEARFAADPDGARHAISQVRQSAREAMSEMEAMLEQLRAAPLGNTGLVEAIRKQSEALAFRTGAEVDVRIGTLPPDDAFAPGAHQAVYRVAQEALANIGRHARARHIRVSLETMPLNVELRVEDDGIGFTSETSPAGMGIHNMRARAAEIGAGIDVGPSSAGGTSVTLSVPYETSDIREYRSRHALRIALLLGAATIFGILSLVERGPSLGNAFVIFFTLAFVQHLRTWLRLRRGAGAAGPTHSESMR
jgi:signal transduction histidine kinase